MRVVICVPSGPTGERFESVLRARGYDTLRLEHLVSAQVLDLAADVFICDRRITRVVRSASSSAHIITTLAKLDDKHVAAALEAGAIDIVLKSAGAEELIARVTLPERMARHVAVDSLAEGAVSEGWGDAQDVVTSHLATFFGGPVRTMECRDEDAPVVSARIRLTRSEDGSTMDLLVGCSKASARALLEVLAPGLPITGAALRDGLRETANNLAGALKRSLQDEGVGVTMGLPADCGADVHALDAVTWSVASGDAVLCLSLQTRRGRPRCLPVVDLVPGMVLQHDVLNPSGVPFVRTGTALTERTIERLADVLGGSFLVSVADGDTDDDAEELERSGMVLFEAV